ncbi:LysR family transcriptional regulator [Liquorilactobacillus capillatus DSM 19910]|uniref:LysR family transcriptional regulator n=2 Tax=Liquorilactobacillus capillatus TaxID=480931 RepID=A0A0R1M0Q8_9LACO|nr:LysR family transcriptional regulator [Liquorilactobacillus capillatus DSM 19910]
MKRVANVMSITQSSVSAQLKQLERETNTTLLEKVGRNVELTATAKKLITQVRPIIDSLEAVETSLTGADTKYEGIVRIGAFSSALQSLVIPAIAAVNQQYPAIDFRLTELEPPASLTALSTQQIDLALVAYIGEMMPLPNNLTALKLGTDELKVLVNTQNDLAHQKKVSINDLHEQDWVMEPDGAYLSDKVWQLCQAAGYQPHRIATFQSYAAIRRAITYNMGIGVLPNITIPPQLAATKLLTLTPMQQRHFYLVSRKAQSHLKTIKVTQNQIATISSQVLTVHQTKTIISNSNH